MDLEEFKSSRLFEPTDEEIKRFLKEQNDMKEKHKGGKWELDKYNETTGKGDGIPELVGYNLSSVWKDITHSKSEFYEHSIVLPETGKKGTGNMSLRYSRTCLQEIERVIKTYMRKGDFFLENCCGWSTFGTMAAYYGYDGIGVDIWDLALETSKKQLSEIKEVPKIGNLQLCKMNGLDLQFDNDTFNYVYCNPPFMDSEKYSGLEIDIADKDIDSFTLKFETLMSENYRVLKPDGLCTITINDKRENGYLVPLQMLVINSAFKAGFKLWDFAIAELVKGRNLILRKREYKLKRTAKQHEYVITFKKPIGLKNRKRGEKK